MARIRASECPKAETFLNLFDTCLRKLLPLGIIIAYHFFGQITHPWFRVETRWDKSALRHLKPAKTQSKQWLKCKNLDLGCLKAWHQFDHPCRLQFNPLRYLHCFKGFVCLGIHSFPQSRCRWKYDSIQSEIQTRCQSYTNWQSPLWRRNSVQSLDPSDASTKVSLEKPCTTDSSTIRHFQEVNWQRHWNGILDSFVEAPWEQQERRNSARGNRKSKSKNKQTGFGALGQWGGPNASILPGASLATGRHKANEESPWSESSRAALKLKTVRGLSAHPCQGWTLNRLNSHYSTSLSKYKATLSGAPACLTCTQCHTYFIVTWYF